MRLSPRVGRSGFKPKALKTKSAAWRPRWSERGYRRDVRESQRFCSRLRWRRLAGAATVPRDSVGGDMFLDWLLASFHHLTVFSLAGILSAEIFLTAGPIDDRLVLRIARVDAWFGIMAALVVAAGVL